MELHHKNHHQTYVNSYNEASEKYSSALQKGDIAAQMALKPLINFHGGGHLNHSLFWQNLAPKKSGGGEPPSGKLAEAIQSRWGGLDAFKGQFNTALAGVQGSGWAWLVKDTQTGDVTIQTYAVRRPVGMWDTLQKLMRDRIRILLWGDMCLCLGLMLGNTRTSKSGQRLCVMLA